MNGVIYYFQIEAWSQGANSSWSNVASVTMPGYTTTPTILAVSTETATTLFLSWTDSDTSPSNFTIAVGNLTSPHLTGFENLSCATLHCSSSGTGYFWVTVGGLANRTPYFFQVEEWGGSPVTNSTWSNTVEGWTGVAPVAPVVPATNSLDLWLLIATFVGIVVTVALWYGSRSRRR